MKSDVIPRLEIRSDESSASAAAPTPPAAPLVSAPPPPAARTAEAEGNGCSAWRSGTRPA